MSATTTIAVIETENFAGLPDGQWMIGTVTRVTGANGAGKTSLGRAIAYAMTGLSIDGSAAGDRYRADPEKPMQVRLTLGDNRKLIRRRTKSAGTVSIDGLPCTDTQLEDLWKMSQLALLVQTWPGAYFALSEAKRRELFVGLLPAPDYEAAFRAACGQEPSLVDWSQSPASIYKAWNQKRIALEKEGAAIGGQIRELDVQLAAQAEATGGDPAEIEAELVPLQGELAEARAIEDKLQELLRIWGRYHHDRDAWAKARDVVPSFEPTPTCPTCKQLWPEGQRTPAAPSLPPEPTMPDCIEPQQADWLDARNVRSEIETKVRDLEARLRVARAGAEVREKGQERRDRLEATRLELRSQYAVAKSVETALHPKEGIWSSCLSKSMAMLTLPGYRFELESDGKECFRVLQEKNGVPIEACSSGERIKFGLALAGLIADLAQPPVRIVFLEHTDLLDRVPRPPQFQLVAERVAKAGDLVVEVVQ